MTIGTQDGSSVAYSIYGGPTDSTLTGGNGNDYISGGAGSDKLDGGAGNDTLVFDAADTIIDGGTGMDTLVLTAGTDIDFSALGDIIHNIEVIDLTQNGAHKLNGLTVQEVFDMTDSAHTLTIFGDSADTVTLVNPVGADANHTWTKTGENVIENGHTLDIYNNADKSVTLKVEDTTAHTIV
jgi:plastocyanin